MYTSRRNFLKKTALALAGTTVLSNEIFAAKKTKELLGVQLYSIRDDMKKDPLGSLKQLAEMGYKNVEHANYGNRKFYGYAASEFKKLLGDLGLKMPSGHTVMSKKHWDEDRKDFTDEWKMTVEDAAIVGQQFVISPWLDDYYRKSYDGLKQYMEVFNKCGELCKKSGMKFGYHNHDFEFSEKLNGVKVFDIILQNTDPSLVAQQLDIGNLYNGGAKALDVMQQYPDRFESMHVKDEIKSGNEKEPYESTVLGKGIVPVKEVIDLGRKSGGTIHFIIEQESYQGKTPMECMKEDLAIMKKWGYK
ncbi:sugar phosphate isomerase/epimerase family protein [Agriterribacter sp.]|uniref:sugar phosphate isomerase/epimerase family protein n=1 Tax=Agriterribacter sp. TaxID=2821509 RepID=UPI002CBB0D41|nr:sugar phosphate isomerase/epimerase family protein [Agriterribacter sp.]HRO45346.1 sugar phosphate isomerase/epimerase family protein [Agriterribacter sp.]HRQ17093.1 sugar phosphate isomerase/epimerase family protein [Agriterribacter sp.]